MTSLDTTLASQLASLALTHIRREYPNKLDHVLSGPEDLRGPRELHPVFYGSFDWHSNVHGYWLLATLLRRYAELPEQVLIADLFNAQLTDANIAAEVAYLERPSSATFERPYGWAWLLMLAAELARHETESGRRWSRALTPLAEHFAQRFRAFLPKAAYPIRVGTHFNSAFACALTVEYAAVVGDDHLTALIRDKAIAWYSGDVDCQAWEPGGDDFLSSALVEAECMRRVLGRDAWSEWIDRFLPRLAAREPRTLFTPVSVSDRTDGKIAHLDGLNLSRAWCWRLMASSLNDSDPRKAVAIESADQHLAASLPHIAGDYAGEHWLATYALLALMADPSLRSV